MTLGSLFDGIGGFPLSGMMHGIEPVWASEIEPFPILVTTKRFPQMKHLGSVTDIDGAEIEPVDIITFGSPCQDLSVAGLQKGIHDGERSNLFFEAVRIIKEMRAHDRATGRTDEHCRPRFAVWENVPGAFSSNKGRDFQAVLQALCEVADPDVSVPMPEKGKWSKAGCIVGDGYSVAWRTYDAQYWGVPQRRKRIYLVADFAGERAGEILFEREGVRGNPAEGGEAREGTADDAAGSAGGSAGVKCLNPWDSQTIRQYSIDGVHPALASNSGAGQDRHGIVYPVIAKTLTAEHDASPCVDRGQNMVCYGIGSYDSNAMKSGNPHSGIYVADTSRTLDLNGGNPACNQGGMVVVQTYAPNGNHCGAYHESDVSATMNTGYHFGDGGDGAVIVYDCRGNGDGKVGPTLTGDHENRVTDYTAVAVYSSGSFGTMSEGVGCLGTGTRATAEMVAVYPKTTGALCANSHPGSYTGQDAFNDMLPVVPGKPPRKYIVRRLTPLECCRLQGYPDGWTENVGYYAPTKEQVDFFTAVWTKWAEINGTKPKSRNAVFKWLQAPSSDSAEYKAYGNSLAIPCSSDVLGRIARAVKEEKHETTD